MKKILCCFLIIFLVGITVGCNKNANINNMKEGKTKMLCVNIPYSVRISLSVAIGSEGIENTYGKPDIVKTIDRETYEVRNISDGSKLIVDYYDGRVVNMWQLKNLFKKQDFKNIILNESTFEDILKIDPYSTIIGDKEGITEHKLIDNGTVIITYTSRHSSSKENKDWVVNNIEFLDNDPSNLFKNDEVKNLITIK